LSKFRKFIVQPWFYIVILTIGLVFKFYHIDYRYFWLDEVSTIEQTSGLNREGIDQLVPVDEIVNIASYKYLLHLNNYSLSIKDQLTGQAKTMNLNPLHYMILTFWHRIAGDSTFALRLFSVIIYILTLPFVFLVARQLFGSRLSAWVAVSLFAVMPYFHYFSHEARYISLCVFLFFANSYFFMAALGSRKVALWTGYIISGILALYASILLALPFIGHIVLILFSKRYSIKHFLISVSIVFLCYMPWLLFIVRSSTEVVESLSWHQTFMESYNILIMSLFQLAAMARSIVSIEDAYHWFFVSELRCFSTIIYMIVIVIIIISVIYSIRRMKRMSLTFLLPILLASFLFFLISDLFRDAISSLLFRYHYISFSALLLFISFFLASKISKEKILFFLLYIVFATMGIISIINISKDNTWDYFFTYDFTPVRFLDSSEKCLLISDFTSPSDQGITAFLMIASAISSEDVDVYRTSPDNTEISNEINKHSYTDIYVYYASEQLIQNLRLQYGENLIQVNDPELYNDFWKINNPSDRRKETR
jgi:uncharacterized membrane protein